MRILELDTITHLLTDAETTRRIVEAFAHGYDSIQVVHFPQASQKMPQNIRNALSRFYRENSIPGEKRYGLRISEPFPYTFADRRLGRYACVAIRKYVSETKQRRAAIIESILEGLLDGQSL